MSAGKQAASDTASCSRNPSNQSRKPVSHAEQLLRLRDWLLPSGRILVDADRHGNTKWAATDLIWLALCWGWAEPKRITDAFETARDQCRLLGITPLATYQGFMNALVSWTDRMMPVLWRLLHRRMREIGGASWQIDGWVPIGFDGPQLRAPHDVEREDVLRRQLWKRQDGPIPQETDQGHETPQERKEQTPASGAPGVDHPLVAHGTSSSLDVAFGAVEFR